MDVLISITAQACRRPSFSESTRSQQLAVTGVTMSLRPESLEAPSARRYALRAMRWAARLVRVFALAWLVLLWPVGGGFTPRPSPPLRSAELVCAVWLFGDCWQ